MGFYFYSLLSLNRVKLGKPAAHHPPATTSSSQNYGKCHHARKFKLGFAFVFFLNSFLCGSYYYTGFAHMLCEFSFLLESQGQEMGLIVTLVYGIFRFVIMQPNLLVFLSQNYIL